MIVLHKDVSGCESHLQTNIGLLLIVTVFISHAWFQCVLTFQIFSPMLAIWSSLRAAQCSEHTLRHNNCMGKKLTNKQKDRKKSCTSRIKLFFTLKYAAVWKQFCMDILIVTNITWNVCSMMEQLRELLPLKFASPHPKLGLFVWSLHCCLCAWLDHLHVL